MNILGIGTLELVFIFLLIIIVLGPKDLPKAGRSLGKLMRTVVMSDTWKAIKQLRYLPNVLMREAGLEEEFKEVEREIQEFQSGQRNIMEGIEKDIEKTSQEFPDWIPYKPPNKESASVEQDQPNTIVDNTPAGETPALDDEVEENTNQLQNEENIK